MLSLCQFYVIHYEDTRLRKCLGAVLAWPQPAEDGELLVIEQSQGEVARSLFCPSHSLVAYVQLLPELAEVSQDVPVPAIVVSGLQKACGFWDYRQQQLLTLGADQPLRYDGLVEVHPLRVASKPRRIGV